MGAALEHDRLGVGDCLGRQRTLLAELQPENFAGQVKPHDLPAAVAKHFMGSHAAALDMIDILRRLVIAENLAVARKRHDGPHHLHPLAKCSPLGHKSS
jgi:hypothetical protein